MGREAHLLRLALGRSADSSLPWSEQPPHIQRIAESAIGQVEGESSRGAPRYQGSDPSRPQSFGIAYNDKGRPVSKATRSLDDEQVKAQNEVLELAGEGLVGTRDDWTTGISSRDARTSDNVATDGDGDVVMRDAGSSTNLDDSALQQRETLNGDARSHSQTKDYIAALLECEDEVVLWMDEVYNFVAFTATFGLNTVRRQVLTFRSTGPLSLSEVISANIRRFGVLDLLTAGYPVALMDTLMAPRGDKRTLFDDLIDLLEVSELNIFHTCLRLASYGSVLFFHAPLQTYSTLQRLRIVPARPLIPPTEWFFPFGQPSQFRWNARQWWAPIAASCCVILRNSAFDLIWYWIHRVLDVEFLIVRSSKSLSAAQLNFAQRGILGIELETVGAPQAIRAPLVRFGQVLSIFSRPLMRTFAKNVPETATYGMDAPFIRKPLTYANLPYSLLVESFAQLFTLVAMAPLEAVLFRAIARLYLGSSSPTSSDATPAWLIEDVYPLVPSFSDISFTNMVSYMAKFSLNVFLQTGFETALLSPLIYACSRFQRLKAAKASASPEEARITIIE